MRKLFRTNYPKQQEIIDKLDKIDAPDWVKAAAYDLAIRDIDDGFMPLTRLKREDVQS